jgi:predicted phage terminase large subunit-like protein
VNLSKPSKADVLHDAQVEYARQSLTGFKEHIYTRYVHAPHLELVDEALMRVVEYIETGGTSGTQFLVIEMPPRHGKSFSVSQFLPAWFLGRNPDKRVMLTGYQAELVTKFGRRVRNMIYTTRFRETFPHTRVSKESSAAHSFEIIDSDGEGGLEALGILGGATGKGAHLLICDDLIRGRKDAESETVRNSVWDAFTNDIYSRLEPGGAVIVMGTRWHEDDPIGRIKNQFENVECITIPALIETEEQAARDPLGRKVGEALWPARYNADTLSLIRTRMGEYGWSSLYQQSPTPAGGNLFKRDWFALRVSSHDLPRIIRRVRFWDLAMSEKTSADYTAGILLAEGEDGHIYVEDVKRDMVDWGNLPEWMATVMLQDGPNVAQGIEEAGYMSKAIQALNIDKRLRGYQIWGYPKDRDKYTNALPFVAHCASGVVHLVKAHWNESFVGELCAFPLGAYDDQVDAVAGAWGMLAGGGDEVAEVGYADSAQFSYSDY